MLCMLTTVSGLYSTPPQPPRLEAVPTDQDFIAALKALGLNPHKAAKADDSNQTGVPRAASLQLLAKGTMYHFQLLLRTFAAVCNYKQQVFSPRPEHTSVLCCMQGTLKLHFVA